MLVAQVVRLGLKELPLVAVARSPGEDAADVQPFPLHLAEHVLRKHAFGGAGVVGAAGGVDVMVAGVEAVLPRIDPANQVDVHDHVAAWVAR